MVRRGVLAMATLVLAATPGCVHAPEAAPTSPPSGVERRGPLPSPSPSALSSSRPTSTPPDDGIDKAEARGPFAPSMAYPMAAEALQKARMAPDGPKRIAAFLEAATLYERALGVDPAADQAPEAAILGAFAYKQAAEYTKAVDLYKLFLARYAAEDKLANLDLDDPARAKERIRHVRTVTETLAAAYILMFDYEAAATHFDGVARQRRFDEAYRRDAAQNAAILHANLGAPEKAAAAREVFVRLGPDARAKANVDLILAMAGFHGWEPSVADTDDVRAARKARQKALEKVVATYERTDAAAPAVLEAAYRLWQIRRGEKDGSAASWCKKVERAYETYFHTVGSRDFSPDRRAARSWAFGSREADRAAECVVRRADLALRADHPPDGLPRVAPRADLTAYHAAAKTLQNKLSPALEPLALEPGHFGSPLWAVEARAREGAFEDGLHRLLEAAAPAKGSAAWKEREAALRSTQDRAARADLEAVTWAATYGVAGDGALGASRRLALFLERHGPASLAALRSAAARPPFETRSGMPLRPLPRLPLGKTLSPPPSGVAPPAPVPAPR